ncbi:MAG: DUF4837 family protein [Bacteroidales bacterium]|nr:DUF4837 family protein [Bacteroidales bacterium]
MKHGVTFMFAALLLLTACHSRQNEAIMKKSSSGKTCEVLLAADKATYSGDSKALIDSIFREPQAGLPQPEPRFDLVNIPVSSLHNTQMFRMHRNIVLCDVNPENPDKVYISHDKWAAPQTMVDIAASSDSALQSLLRRYEKVIKREIYKDEHQRIINAFHNVRNVELMKRVKEKFGFGMTFSEDFRWAQTAEEDPEFAWIHKETKDFSLGVLVHTMPYRDENQFVPEKILNRLDTMMRHYVPGPAEGSYMGTERRFDIEHNKVDYEGSSYCIETRGLWRTFGDFMGGPFVTYTLLSPDGRQIVEVTGYVYCPRFDKRDYLMQVEGICNSIRWDE